MKILTNYYFVIRIKILNKIRHVLFVMRCTDISRLSGGFFIRFFLVIVNDCHMNGYWSLIIDESFY